MQRLVSTSVSFRNTVSVREFDPFTSYNSPKQPQMKKDKDIAVKKIIDKEEEGKEKITIDDTCKGGEKDEVKRTFKSSKPIIIDDND